METINSARILRDDKGHYAVITSQVLPVTRITQVSLASDGFVRFTGADQEFQLLADIEPGSPVTLMAPLFEGAAQKSKSLQLQWS